MSFTELFDWLADREGRAIMVELTVRDDRGALIFPVSFHAELGRVEHAEGVGPGVTVALAGTTDERDRLWFDPQRVSRVEFMDDHVVRVWLDERTCVQLAGKTTE